MSTLTRGPIEVVGAVSPETASMVNSGITGLSSLASSIFGKPQTATAQTSSTPPWILPVAIGGVGILAIAMLAGKKK